MRSSTATGTTVTADLPARAPYRGRFAPSPTGSLHQGSLLAALASWLDARKHQGRWIIRMEDLDPPREVPGAAAEILQVLERLGMGSDEPVLYQSSRHAAYHQALEHLVAVGLAYRCSCPRSSSTGHYAGTCRDRNIQDPHAAWRLRLPVDAVYAFEDQIQGSMQFGAEAIGDPILFRRDGLPAYQLAVVVDDAFQGITDVVRGADLLESTGWQLAIAAALGLPRPRYAHVPVLTEPGGAKLAKSRRSVAISNLDERKVIAETLQLLGLSVTNHLKAAPVSEMLQWAVTVWDPHKLQGVLSRPLPS